MPWAGIQFDETHQNTLAQALIEQYHDQRVHDRLPERRRRQRRQGRLPGAELLGLTDRRPPDAVAELDRPARGPAVPVQSAASRASSESSPASTASFTASSRARGSSSARSTPSTRPCSATGAPATQTVCTSRGEAQ